MCLQGILFLEPNPQEQWRDFSFTTLTVRNRYIRGGKCENAVFFIFRRILNSIGQLSKTDRNNPLRQQLGNRSSGLRETTPARMEQRPWIR